MQQKHQDYLFDLQGYRYSPRFIRSRFNCELSQEFLAHLTPEQQKIMQPLPPRRIPV